MILTFWPMAHRRPAETAGITPATLPYKSVAAQTCLRLRRHVPGSDAKLRTMKQT